MLGRGARKRERERSVSHSGAQLQAERGWGQELPTSVWRHFQAPSCG